MGKTSKKRNKKYSGAAKTDNTVRVHKVEAVVRSDFGQWIYDHKKFLRTVSITTLIVAAVLFLVIQGIIAITK
jgi:hypothetical protein